MRLGPFSEHILDAIKINFKRLFLYAKLSWGLSIFPSLGLILFEIIILPLAWYYDLVEKKWHGLGLSVLSQDFIDMKETPEFKNKATDIPKGEFLFQKVSVWRKEIDHYHKSNQWTQAYDYLIAKRTKMEREGAHKVLPLLFHFLESVHRANALTINSLPKITSKELKEDLLAHRRWFIFWQMLGFEGAMILDLLAWPLRKKGLLIFEQDVPKIPVPKI